ncbi:hypothetical protein [Pseudomonas sp. PS02302]|uniref:hypothetical protein n=1 Tax=Pseudomonas sp. PS02302 TaxID=2991428 RepID=UPI00249CDF22|nr:hypothetical protein [Pseudomonas sp. PS02302]
MLGKGSLASYAVDSFLSGEGEVTLALFGDSCAFSQTAACLLEFDFIGSGACGSTLSKLFDGDTLLLDVQLALLKLELIVLPSEYQSTGREGFLVELGLGTTLGPSYQCQQNLQPGNVACKGFGIQSASTDALASELLQLRGDTISQLAKGLHLSADFLHTLVELDEVAIIDAEANRPE